MAFIAKSPKGKEFIFNRNYTIACRTKKQAEQLAKYLNENNTKGKWQLKDGEIWSVHGDVYGVEPIFKVKKQNGNIVITYNI